MLNGLKASGTRLKLKKTKKLAPSTNCRSTVLAQVEPESLQHANFYNGGVKETNLSMVYHHLQRLRVSHVLGIGESSINLTHGFCQLLFSKVMTVCAGLGEIFMIITPSPNATIVQDSCSMIIDLNILHLCELKTSANCSDGYLDVLVFLLKTLEVRRVLELSRGRHTQELHGPPLLRVDRRRSRTVDVFVDYELRRGASMENDRFQVIEGSKIAVIVFSRRYAESGWCLDELVKIMECRTLGQIVFPIFYDVDPSDVRKQTGTFATAFLNHERRLYEVKEKLQLWRDALTEAANLSGFVFGDADWYEGKFIREIVIWIIRVLNRSTCLELATNLVGIGSRVQEISNCLDVGGSNDVRIIRIWGIGGVGKTTVAKAIFNKYQDTFEGKNFLQNVRERKLVHLQEQLLFAILKLSNIKESNVDQGILEIELRLHDRRVLATVDDLDCMERLEALAIKRDSFGAGSRIIITTRDEHLLKMLGVGTIYELPAMNRGEGLELLSWHAFRKDCPEEEYIEITKKNC